MFVKLNILVICAVLLHFGDSNNCDGVLKCVTNKVGDAISAYLNGTIDNIEDDNLLNSLTRFLVQNFSDLIIENPSLKRIGRNAKIYIQKFKLIESAHENKPIVNTIKYDLLDMNSNGANFDNNTLNIVLREVNKIISNNYNSSVIIVPMIEKTATHSKKTNMIDKNRVDTINKSKFEHTNYNEYYQAESYEYTTKQETVTTSVYLNDDDIPGKKENIETTTESFIDIPGVTVEVSKKHTTTPPYHTMPPPYHAYHGKHTSDTYAKNGMNNTEVQASTHKINMIKEKNFFRDNYIDDTNDLFRDINEVAVNELDHDNQTDYLDIDYVDMYKDTTNEDVEYTPTVYIPTTTVAAKIMIEQNPADKIDSVYSWIATVFVMNQDNKQFEYICDGVLLSERVVLTAARCVTKSINVTVDADNILIILGKRSLQSMGLYEKVLKVESIKIHENFVSTGEMVDNDLAIVVLAESVVSNVDIQPAPLGLDDISAPLATATTGWHVSGLLQPLYLGLQSTEKSKMDDCKKFFCATLSDSEITCPSYGGMLIERQDDDQWRLKGIARGNPTNTGVCLNKDLTFTKIEKYLEWIEENIQKTHDRYIY